MNSAQMIENMIDGLDSKPLTVRDIQADLERISFRLEQEHARRELKLRLVNSFRAVEYRQSGVVDLDHNPVTHHQFDEIEQL